MSDAKVADVCLSRLLYEVEEYGFGVEFRTSWKGGLNSRSLAGSIFPKKGTNGCKPTYMGFMLLFPNTD